MKARPELTKPKEKATEQLVTTAVPHKMGATLHNDGCTFRLWAPHAKKVQLKIWNTDGTIRITDMMHDSAAGFGSQCWAVFIPGVTERTNYRYIIIEKVKPVERIDAFGQCVRYPNWTGSNPDDSDARSVVVNRNFSWDRNYIVPDRNKMVIYQLHIGTFYDKNIMGPADISSIISKLGYLKNELGVNAIQLLPFTEFASPFSMGYNSMLPYAIEHDYGTPADLKALINACHQKGIAVLFDVVYNHIDVREGNAVPKPYSLSAYDGWKTDFNPDGVFFYGGDEINTPWGSPRPDYSRPEVKHYLADNALMWTDEYQVDGLRFDSTKCIRKRQSDTSSGSCNGSDIGNARHNYGWELLQYINDEIDDKYTGKITIAEDLDNNDWITRETDEGGAGFDAQWDSDLKTNLRDAVTKANDADIDIEALANALKYSIGGDPVKRIIYFESHDEAKYKRLPDLIFPGDAEGWFARKKTMLAMGVLMTAPGIPMIFQGSEFLDWHKWSDQTPVDWNQKTRFPDFLLYCKDLINLRTGSNNYSIGLSGTSINIIQANASTKVIAYHRWKEGSGKDDVIVVANFSNQIYDNYTIGFPYAGEWKIRLNSDANVYSDRNDFGSVYSYDATARSGLWDNMPFHGNIALGPYTIIILSR